MDERYCQNEGRGYCGECVSGDLRDKISGLQDEANKAHAAGTQEGLAEGEAKLTAQCNADRLTIEDVNRANERAQKAEAKLADKCREADQLAGLARVNEKMWREAGAKLVAARHTIGMYEATAPIQVMKQRAEEAEAKLATAKEEGRREGLEEAAKTCELQSEFEAGIVKLALTLIRADLLAKAKGGAFENNNS